MKIIDWIVENIVLPGVLISALVIGGAIIGSLIMRTIP